jgi:acetyltransferase
MTIRNLEALFEPRSIALIGASNQAGSVGAVLARNLFGGGFAGPMFAVNPHEKTIAGVSVHASVSDLPQAPDLAVIATPGPSVPGIVGELAARGCRAAVVISAGLAEPKIRQSLLSAARPGLLRIVGPNCLGFISPGAGINASFAHLTPRPGGLALIAQSGAVTTAALDWAAGRELGFSHVITLGDMADVDFGDLLDFLATDPATTAILLYVESITQARKFMSAARMAARGKPVVAIKSGRSEAGAKAAWSHTGALAGSDLVYDAAFRRAGILRVDSLRDLFDAAVTLTSGVEVAGDALTILTNGGGAGVMAVDALEAQGGRLAEIPAAAIKALNAELPATWSHGNPVDIIGDAPPERYGAATRILRRAELGDAILAINCPTALADSAEAAQAVIAAVQEVAGPPVLTCWMGDPAARESRRLFAKAAIPTFETPEEATAAFMRMAERQHNFELLSEVPAQALAEPDRAAAAKVLSAAAAEGRADLTEPEAKALLAAYGVPVLESRLAADADAAAALASDWTGPFALKILSPDITHKSDIGGVALNLGSAEAVALTAREMSQRVTRLRPKARQDGFILQQMTRRKHGRELIVGLSNDPVFGPVILFGHGGVEVEVAADRVMGLPPLNRPLGRAMIARTRISRLLGAYRDVPAADLDAIADVLARTGQLAADFPQIAELDINPLVADETGVLAMDARVRLGDPQSLTRPAIRPYPAELASNTALRDGQAMAIRAIRPQDAGGLLRLIEQSDAEDVRLRVHGSLRALPRAWAGRLSQIDYEREMALVGLIEGEIAGALRLIADPEGESAEFALMVRPNAQARGVGSALLEQIIAYARDRGLKRLWGQVLAENQAMLNLAERFGFTRRSPDRNGLVRIELKP